MYFVSLGLNTMIDTCSSTYECYIMQYNNICCVDGNVQVHVPMFGSLASRGQAQGVAHTHNPLVCTTCTVQQTVQNFIWWLLSKIKRNCVQPTQTVTSAHGPDVSQFHFCTREGQREEIRLAVDRFLRGIRTLQVPVRCVWWAGAAAM